MKAVCWTGKNEVKVETVPDPKILNPRDAIIRVTSTAICGSDLHLYGGLVPMMEAGDILGHEFMGEVVELGPAVKNLKVGDRVVVPFDIGCGQCFFCTHGLWSACDNSNPNAELAEKFYGYTTAGLYGYSHITGGYAGGQAEYVRVAYADANAFVVPDGLPDEKVLFLTDIFPTGYMAAENCNIEPGDTVAVWGCGPVGQFAIRSALMLGAAQVLAFDDVPERLAMAEQGGAVVFDRRDGNELEWMTDMTGGRGPDSCLDAVGFEAHGTGLTDLDAAYDTVKTTVGLATDSVTVLRQAIMACRKGGTLSIPGVYVGVADKVPIGPAFQKGLSFKMGQTHVQNYLRPLMERVQQGDIDPSFVITHTLPLDAAPEAYHIFQQKLDNCIKVVLKPGGNGRAA